MNDTTVMTFNSSRATAAALANAEGINGKAMLIYIGNGRLLFPVPFHCELRASPGRDMLQNETPLLFLLYRAETITRF